MARSIALALALTACAPFHAYRNPGRPTPTWRYAVDMVPVTAGLAAGVDGYTRGDDREMAIGLGVFALFWLPYWFVSETP